jgi:CDP-diglyceride synthetase
MSSFFENNIWFLVASLAVAAIVWKLSSKIEKTRVRRGLRATLIFLMFPVFYLGHPFLYYQVWVLIAASIINLNLMWLAIFLVVWAVFVGLSQIGVKNES